MANSNDTATTEAKKVKGMTITAKATAAPKKKKKLTLAEHTRNLRAAIKY